MPDIDNPTKFTDEQDTCRTMGCDGDPNNGDGWDGYCGNCADIGRPDESAGH